MSACNPENFQKTEIGAPVQLVFRERDLDPGSPTYRRLVPVNLTGATCTLIVEKPGGDVEELAAPVFDAALGIARWLSTSAGDLDEVGTWRAQGRAVFLDGRRRGTPVTAFVVLENLIDPL